MNVVFRFAFLILIMLPYVPYPPDAVRPAIVGPIPLLPGGRPFVPGIVGPSQSGARPAIVVGPGPFLAGGSLITPPIGARQDGRCGP